MINIFKLSCRNHHELVVKKIHFKLGEFDQIYEFTLKTNYSTSFSSKRTSYALIPNFNCFII
ncbi:hypothetical protein BpHYR1_033937 [Brachionus plicatilis]|uniref:Uncharacterized protein n=1 Tax=Brachionus plicatilis TaxID=10195 RepID=A0A3M7RMX9_BRAPC|nr:hypothetical protein BpHYR1_033937 [Brachionus plicatilis]